MVTIVNAVGSGDLGVELDLQTLGDDLSVPFTEYDPSNYHGLYVRLVEGGPLITVYRSGKYIISGCSSFQELESTNEEFIIQMADLGICSRSLDPGFTVQNVVCTEELSSAVDLNTLSIGLGLEAVEYEPEQFPGLVYRPPEIGAVILVFANEKVVITGAAEVATAEEAFSQLQTRIQNLIEA
ncbi:TATA-box-binding protein [Natronorubrum thiooxidans]|uniref:TATA-box-binding protein n=1 Tax=Natronorubrum thiooxidans TaxID=308853 RepID=A0A1N7H0K5_9EURY|nr:TATA-box-binding protein [Natronorubrum thiooxidans]SIS18355.1 TATA binding protein of transcription factor TFIID [Natronorubrum thiooxidans]